MKHLILSTIIFLSLFAKGQSPKNSIPTETNQNDNTATYRLFPTQNTWTFIKLDTRNGQMWQVQFAVKDNNRFVTDLNPVSLVFKEDEVTNRFTLYSTQNTYNSSSLTN